MYMILGFVISFQGTTRTVLSCLFGGSFVCFLVVVSPFRVLVLFLWDRRLGNGVGLRICRTLILSKVDRNAHPRLRPSMKVTENPHEAVVESNQGGWIKRDRLSAA